MYEASTLRFVCIRSLSSLVYILYTLCMTLHKYIYSFYVCVVYVVTDVYKGSV
jgi:hypothetical protein